MSLGKGHDPLIDTLIDKNRATKIKDAKRGIDYSKANTDLTNRAGAKRFEEVAEAQDRGTRAERLARKLHDIRERKRA